MGVCEEILDLARWAPSGDNTQPWRFEIISDRHVAVHGFDTRTWCLYDFDGHASHMAHGALLETIRIAASGARLSAQWAVRTGSTDEAPVYDVYLAPDPGLTPDPLLPFVRDRTVQRRPIKTTPLTRAQRDALREAPGPGYDLVFFESWAERWRIARLLWNNAYIRLSCPEAYAVHKDIIEWGARFSKERIPEQAVGVGPLTAKLMRWVMKDWSRVEFFNRYLLGTIAPRVQLDLLPAIFCGGHVLMRARTAPVNLEDYARVGGAMQRLWLTATAVGLSLQPEMTPVIFRWYARSGRVFSRSQEILRAVSALAEQLERLIGAAESETLVFFCRVGQLRPPRSRSTRLNLDELMISTGTRLKRPHG